MSGLHTVVVGSPRPLFKVSQYNYASCFVQKRAAGEGERPEPVKTHLRNMIIIPEMIGSIIGVYNGKVFMPVEVKVRRSRQIVHHSLQGECCNCVVFTAA